MPLPFVGCSSDGQIGPENPPREAARQVLADPSLAGGLAFYQSQDLGVAAPRGWHCIGLYGASGASIIVTPEPHAAKEFLRADAPRLIGPAVVLSRSDGGSSGRFAVAVVAARIFPVAKNYVQAVIDEDLVPKDRFPTAPYPTDRLVRRGDTLVEFTTPAGVEGIGTEWLGIGNLAVRGVDILRPDRDMSLTELAIRLPPDQQHLAPTIIADIEAHGP